MSEIIKALQAEWTSVNDKGESQNDIAYKTAYKWCDKGYTKTGGRAMWLTGGNGQETLEEVVQTVICHAWELFVNGSIQDPKKPLADRCKAAIGTAIKRVTRQGRLFRESDRNPTAGHAEACRGRLHRTTFEAHEGAETEERNGTYHVIDDVHVMSTPGIAWGEDRDDEKAYRVPENREALDRLLRRVTADNCERHSADDCRSYRKIIAALADTGGNVAKAAKAMDVPVRTLGYQLHHVADALRQVLAIDEATTKRERADDPVHVQTRSLQETVTGAGPAADMIPPTAAATGGHDWTRPGADRGTGRLGRDWFDVDAMDDRQAWHEDRMESSDGPII